MLLSQSPALLSLACLQGDVCEARERRRVSLLCWDIIISHIMKIVVVVTIIENVTAFIVTFNFYGKNNR